MDRDPKLRDKSLLKKLREGLDATETKFFQSEGKVTDERECIDYATRHTYLDTALKLRGDLAQPREGEGNTFAADIINNIFLAIKGAEERGIFPKGTLREES